MGIIIGSCVAQESASSVANSSSSSRMMSPPRRETLVMGVIDRHSDDEADAVLQISRFRSHSTFPFASNLGSSFGGYQTARIMYGTLEAKRNSPTTIVVVVISIWKFDSVWYLIRSSIDLLEQVEHWTLVKFRVTTDSSSVVITETKGNTFWGFYEQDNVRTGEKSITSKSTVNIQLVD